MNTFCRLKVQIQAKFMQLVHQMLYNVVTDGAAEIYQACALEITDYAFNRLLSINGQI